MLTQDELERRRSFITATDVPAILGVNPHRNAMDVWVEKTQPVRQWEGNDATEAGNLLEPAILDWARTKLGVINEGDWRVHENGILAATLDGILPNGEIVECKSHGIVGPAQWDRWGKEGTDEFPDVYAIQMQTQLLVTGAPRGWLPALIGGRGFVLYTMERNDDIHELIMGCVDRFWKRIQDRVPPEEIPHLETMQRMDRIKGKAVEIDDDIARRYRDACDEFRLAEKARNEAQEALLAALGDAEVATWTGGSFTYKQTVRKSYTVAESTFRQLRAVKKKEDAAVA